MTTVESTSQKPTTVCDVSKTNTPSEEAEMNNPTATSTRWQCPKCKLFNNLSQWQCIACYTPITAVYRSKKNRKNSRNKNKKNKKTEDSTNDEKDKNANNSTNETSKTDINKVQHISPSIPSFPIPKIMRALIKNKPGKGFILVNDYLVPDPGDGELLVRSFTTSICGSDAILYNWTAAAQIIAKIPFIPGHESAGMVVKRGPNTRGFISVGQRIAVENHFFCGDCYQCNHQRRDICSNMGQFGHGKGTKYGGCAEYFIVPESNCFKITSDISWTDAALLEPLGVAVNACKNCDLSADESLLVIGCGSIGCMVVGVAKSMGVKNIFACDVIPFKLEKAVGMGATHVFNSGEHELQEYIKRMTDGVGVGRLIECSGNASMLNASFACVRKGGCMVLVGIPKAPLHVENVLTDVIFRSLQIRTIHGRRIFDDWKTAQKLLVQGKICLDSLVTHGAVPLSKFEEGYHALFSGKAMKVVFDITH